MSAITGAGWVTAASNGTAGTVPMGPNKFIRDNHPGLAPRRKNRTWEDYSRGDWGDRCMNLAPVYHANHVLSSKESSKSSKVFKA